MIRSRRLWRAVIGVLAGGAVVAAVSGCVVIPFELPNQPDISSVRVSTSFCASGSANCADNGNSMFPATAITTATTGQVLLGYRIPSNATAPATLTSAAGVLVFSRSPSYESELQRLDPAPAGQQWVGYLSNNFSYDGASAVQVDNVTATFGLVQGADGNPFAGPFKFRTVIGARATGGAFPANRPVVCGTSLTATFDEDTDPGTATFVTCVDSPTPAVLNTDNTIPTRDLGVVASSALGTARQGTLGTVPFILRYAGTAGGASVFALSASTTLPGAVAAPTIDSLTPAANSDNPVSVAVGVPPNAAPGTYNVTLTATQITGQVRTGTGKLIVTAAPPGTTGAATGGAGAGAGGAKVGVAGASAAKKARLRILLPSGFSAAQARAKGLKVLIGSTQKTRVGVKLFQGKGKKPVVAKGALLRVPGPTTVVLKSSKLKKGPFRIVAAGAGFSFNKAGALTK